MKIDSREYELKQNTLVEVMNAINNNLSQQELFMLFQFVLENQLGVKNAQLLLNNEGEWQTIFNTHNKKEIKLEKNEQPFKEASLISNIEKEKYESFDIVVPVFHQSKALSYLFMGDGETQNLKESSIIINLPFIQTLCSVISVAVENKKLYREHLKQALVKKDLELAKQMQKMLIPEQLPYNEFFSVSAFYQPHFEIGGDFYDVIALNNQEYFVCTADVSGKGVAAAILMSNLQASLRTILNFETNLSKILAHLNQMVFENSKGEKFITGFFAIYNTVTHLLTYINAAHTASILFNNQKITALESNYPGLGMIEGLQFEQTKHVKVDKNALLLSYTDGLGEMQNSSGTEFQENRLQEIIFENHSLSPDLLCQKIMKELDVFTNEKKYFDDIAVVVCKMY